MSDDDIKLFLDGEFKVECFRIELNREGDNPMHIAGPGLIELDQHHALNFRFHIDAPSVQALQNELNRPRDVGRIVPESDYIQFTAYTYNLPVWHAKIAGVGCNLGFGHGGMAFGQLREIYQINDAHVGEYAKDHARLWVRDAIEFAETAVTETEVKRAGKTRGKRWGRDCAEFSIGEETFELHKNDVGVELSCCFEKGGIKKYKHIRIQEALQFALGQHITPCAMEFGYGTTRTTVLRSIASRDKRRIHQNPPLTFKGKALRHEVYEIAKAFYVKICEHTEERWHPLSSHAYYIIQAGSAAIELQCLALGVAAEGIADTAHPSLAAVDKSFENEVDAALAKIAKLGLSEVLTNRIIGAVGGMKSTRGSDRIRAYVKNNGIDQEILTSWRRVRNSAAHGGILNEDSIDLTIIDLDNVLHLCYTMILSCIGYNGVRTNYAALGS